MEKIELLEVIFDCLTPNYNTSDDRDKFSHAKKAFLEAEEASELAELLDENPTSAMELLE